MNNCRRTRVGRKRRKNKHFPRHLECKKGWYYYVRTVAGKTKWYTLQTQDEASALQRWAQIESALNTSAGFDAAKIIERNTQDGGRIKFKQLMDRYVTEVTARKDPNTQSDEKRRAELLTNKFGNVPIGRIGPLDIQNYHDSLREIPYEANRRLALLKHLFRLAVTPWGLLKVNPAREVKKFSEEGIKLNLTEDVLFEKIYPNADFELKAAIMFAFFLAQHEDDVKNLQWKNIHLHAREIKFVRGKTDVEIAIHINDRLFSFIKFIMKNRRQLSPWVISRWDGKSKRLKPFASFRSQWYRALKKAGFRPGDYKFKEIRHLANTLMKNKGVVSDKRRALTGHKSGQSNERYTHPSASDSFEGSEALSSFGPKKF